ncbi:MAG: hypothetical protein Q9195_003334 [Heterodermia aff. obscurata]
MPSPPIPIIFLKSPSQPPETDSYTRLFSPPTYTPIHIPVLTHTLNTGPLLPLLSHPSSLPCSGLIFTSQRAVSAFSLALSQLPSFAPPDWTIYAVGPATTKAIKRCLPTDVVGEEAGTGEALAQIILEDYNGREGPRERKPLLFLTGETHRDVIPRMLSSDTLPPEQRIEVVEMVVYSTSALSSFESSFEEMLEQTEGASVRWVVVFSATGGEAMLKALGWLDGEWKGSGERKTFVASIGPTTRDWLRQGFGFEVDVCARKPSAEGLREGVEAFMRARERGEDTGGNG